MVSLAMFFNVLLFVDIGITLNKYPDLEHLELSSFSWYLNGCFGVGMEYTADLALVAPL